MKYALTALTALTALSGASFAQTVVNGDFSNTSGMNPKAGAGGDTYYNGIPNSWYTNTGEDVTIIPLSYDNNYASFTSNYLDVAKGSQAITVSQDVSGFTPGQQYTLSYDWGNRADESYDMTISMGGQSASHTGPARVVTAKNNSFVFTANADTETLSISFNHTNGDSPTGINTTNFTVTPVNPVPEPSGAALLGLGGLALILRRRK